MWGGSGADRTPRRGVPTGLRFVAGFGAEKCRLSQNNVGSSQVGFLPLESREAEADERARHA